MSQPRCNRGAEVVYPPLFKYKPVGTRSPSVFLAGTLEMGQSRNWQQEAVTALQGCASVIYNPRRENWDASWEQSLDCPEFNGQVTWELEMLTKADVVLMYFDPESKSPISLLELGMLAATRPDNVLVCCPKGFWRKGNVDIVCNRYGVRSYESLSQALEAVRSRCKAARMAA